MLRMFNRLNQLYEKGKSLLIDTILEYHSRKEIAKENSSEPSPSMKESVKESTSKPSPARKESDEKRHQILLHQGKRVLRKIHQSLLLKRFFCGRD